MLYCICCKKYFSSAMPSLGPYALWQEKLGTCASERTSAELAGGPQDGPQNEGHSYPTSKYWSNILNLRI